MFSGELTERIYMDERLNNIPFEYKSSIIHAVQDAIESRISENPDLSREILAALKKALQTAIDKKA